MKKVLILICALGLLMLTGCVCRDAVVTVSPRHGILSPEDGGLIVRVTVEKLVTQRDGHPVRGVLRFGDGTEPIEFVGNVTVHHTYTHAGKYTIIVYDWLLLFDRGSQIVEVFDNR